MYEFKGKVALVTGAGLGIGRAIAVRLAREGSPVAVLDVDRRGAEETAALVRAEGAESAVVTGDVSDRGDVERCVQETLRAFGAIHILVNNAGVGRVAALLDMKHAEWSLVFRINVDGVFHCCQVVAPRMVARRGGRIINIASWFGKVGKPCYSAYCASKFAVIGLTQSLAQELAPHNVTVNAVCPGTVVNTGMREYLDERSRQYGLPTAKEREVGIPLGRVAPPEDIGRAVAFLASEEAAYMTGQAINVSGGLWMH